MWRITALLARDEGASSEAFAEAVRGQVTDALAGVLARQAGVSHAVLSLLPDERDPAIFSSFPIRHEALLEIWCERGEDCAAAAAAVAADAEVASAVAGVFDGARGVAWLAEVVPQKPDVERRTRVKFLAAGEVAEGWTVADAQRYWAEEHPRVARRAPVVWNGLTLYRQYHGRETPWFDLGPSIARTRFVPMCSDMGYAKPGDFLACFSDPEYLRVVRPDEQKFGRPGEMLAFVTDRQTVIAGTAPPA